MSDGILQHIRAIGGGLSNAIIYPLQIDKSAREVRIKLVTDKTFTPDERIAAEKAVRPYVPDYFNFSVNIVKLSPDEEMVKRKIFEAIEKGYKAVSAVMLSEDVKVERTESGFSYTIAVPRDLLGASNLCDGVTAYLKKTFCGEFYGERVDADRSVNDIIIEEEPDEIEYEVAARYFDIADFGFIEGDTIRKRAIYISDLNLVRDEVVICGAIVDIKERKYTNKRGEEKEYLTFILNDGTGSAYATYFLRMRTAEKVKALRVGEYIVMTGKNEEYKGNLRFTGNYIDRGRPPVGFIPEKRASKPVPKYYHAVKPKPFTDMEQTDIFDEQFIPDCLKQNSFVVFDLETTGLNSSPTSGNMDKIIEIAAYKISGGEIAESFTTFVNPERKLSDEIVSLTGITDEMVSSAPTCERVMPDFVKFCSGSILVGHNIAGFDFKFVDYYCAKQGYILDRKIIDTFPLAQELLFLSNYKLNTVAEHFKINFNHHRASDDALATAKIFIELIKLKKNLPTL